MKKGKGNCKGIIQLFKNEMLIREYKFNDGDDRKRMLKIWTSELKPNGLDCYYLIIKPEL